MVAVKARAGASASAGRLPTSALLDGRPRRVERR
ncbi:hypothetical protein B1M_15420 [Burkholderia sp. TJI49]|nr:hypothetical protein B1M_15420 [Burkholderia sp. TJI49]